MKTNLLLKQLSITHPIIQAPMAGATTPALVAAVSNAGGLGSLARVRPASILVADGVQQIEKSCF